MRVMLVLVILLIVGAAGFTAYFIRSVEHDPQVWHVDPLTVPPSDTPNSVRVAPEGVSEHPITVEADVYEVDAATLAAAFEAFVMAQPRVERVAGSVEEGWLTYVQRTEQLRFPDYISVRFYDLEDRPGFSTLAMFSRSRFGYSDMGVNEARVRDWLESIESFAS